MQDGTRAGGWCPRILARWVHTDATLRALAWPLKGDGNAKGGGGIGREEECALQKSFGHPSGPTGTPSCSSIQSTRAGGMGS